MSDASDGGGGVRIPPQQVYAEVLTMKDSIAGLKGAIERHIALQEQTNGAVREDVKELDGRVDGHDSDIVGIKTRLTGIDLDILILKESASKKEARKAPWWSIVAAVGTIITAGFLVLNQIAQYQQQIAIIERIAP
ncbi:hypothetical protein [Microbacterium sp. T32]|uniref:hypothetical protein n=1 Tax=Microbacterium sp. T32 TaxID=1776083 RepID=UPI000B118A5E|nr:hypothetical protein [Microbacterium sp. T32]